MICAMVSSMASKVTSTPASLRAGQSRPPLAFSPCGNEGGSPVEDPDWQAALDKHEWPDSVGSVRRAWVEMLSRFEWDWFVTLTFKNEIHPEAADKRFRVWLDQVNRPLYGRRWRERGQGVYWAKALEWQKRNVIHFHLLMSDTQNLNETLRRLSLMDKWNHIAGFSKIEVPARQECVTRYCAKYIIKGGEIDLSPTLCSYARQT